MSLTQPNIGKRASVLIPILSLLLTIVISNSYLNPSAEGSEFSTNAVPKVIGVQDNSDDNGIEVSPPDTSIESGDTNGSSSDLPDLSSQGNAGNETGSGMTDGLLSEESTSNDTSPESISNDTSPAGDESSNQTVQTQSQVNNQNVNQTTNQNVNIEMKQRLDLKISEEEGEAPISVEEQTRIESQDKIIVTENTILIGPDCRPGNVLDGASNAEDLRILLACQDATGIVMHTKKMDDGDYKFFLKLDPEFEFLVNDKNREETEGFLVVEIVPSHQDGMYLPKDGDRVQVWGAWVTDKPKGWHEIHPTWKVVKI